MTALLHALAPYTDALLFVAAMLFLLLADSLWGDRIRALIWRDKPHRPPERGAGDPTEEADAAYTGWKPRGYR